MADSLQKSILFTVAYFSAFDYPLTVFELWKHLIDKNGSTSAVSYLDVLKTIKIEPLASKLSFNNGYVMLRAEDGLAERRLSRHKLSLANIRAMKKSAKCFLWLPYVRGVFLTGTLSMKNASEKSDWDILLVLAEKRIWIGRLLVSGLLHILGMRRHGKKVKRRFCLNHYLAENGLILEEHNEYSANFVTFSVPIHGEAMHRKYLRANEQWIRQIKPNYVKDDVVNRTMLVRTEIQTKVRAALETILELTSIGSMVNRTAKKYMIEKIEKNPATHQKNADIRYSDVAMVFLPNPHRITMLEKTWEKLTKCV